MEEHCTVHGSFATHATLDATATMTTDAGFLSVLRPDAATATPAELEVVPLGAGLARATVATATGTRRFVVNVSDAAIDLPGATPPVALPPGLSELGVDDLV